MKSLFTTALCLMGVLFTAGKAQAACSGAGATNPLNSLAGTSWAFLTEDGFGDAEIGVFTLSVKTVGTNLVGILTGTETSVSGGRISRLAPLSGKFQVSPGCIWGTLFFTDTLTNYQYAFVNTGTQLWLVSDTLNMPNVSQGQSGSSHGTADLLPAAPQCPAGVSPNSIFAGAWDFDSHEHDFGQAYIGSWTAMAISGLPQGKLNGTYTGTKTGQVIVQAPFGGKYQVYNDCSGGSVSDSMPFTPGFDFVFAGPGKIYYVNDVTGATLGFAGEAVLVH